MRKLTTFLLAGAAVIAVPAIAAPQASAPANTSAAAPAATDAAGNPATSPAATSAANSPASTTASASGGVTAGATVKDTSGGTVGTIESVDGQYAVLATTKNKVRLPVTSFGKGADGPILAMTQAQVDAAAASAVAKTAKP
jgi:hypothetical protein